MNDPIIAYRAIFDALVRDQRYLKSLDWGRPRSGHPEGTVRAHIAELEPNLEALRPRLTELEYWKLKVLIHSHDTFKGTAGKSRAPLDWFFEQIAGKVQSRISGTELRWR